MIKRIPRHLNNVSTLPYETGNAQCARAIIALLQKETPCFIPPQINSDLHICDCHGVVLPAVHWRCMTCTRRLTHLITQ